MAFPSPRLSVAFPFGKPVSTFPGNALMLHRPRPCVSKTAIFALWRAYPHIAKKSPFNSKGLKVASGGLSLAESLEKTRRGRGSRRRNRFRNGGALCHRAVRIGERRESRRTGAGRSENLRRDGRVEPGFDAPRALAGVLRRRSG